MQHKIFVTLSGRRRSYVA